MPSFDPRFDPPSPRCAYGHTFDQVARARIVIKEGSGVVARRAPGEPPQTCPACALNWTVIHGRTLVAR